MFGRIMLVRALTLACLGVAVASPVPDPVLEDRQARPTTYAITGVRDSGIQPRLEIRQMATQTQLYNLFLLALMQYQAVTQSNQLSYYQVAGQTPSGKLRGKS